MRLLDYILGRRTTSAAVNVAPTSTPAPLDVPSFSTIGEEALYVQSLIEKVDTPSMPLHALPYLREIQLIVASSSQAEIYAPDIIEEVLGAKIGKMQAESYSRIIPEQRKFNPTLEEAITASVRSLSKKEAKGLVDEQKTINYALREVSVNTMQKLTHIVAEYKDKIANVNMFSVLRDYEAAKKQYEQAGFLEPIEVQVKQDGASIWRTTDRVMYRSATAYFMNSLIQMSRADPYKIRDLKQFEQDAAQKKILMQTYLEMGDYTAIEKERGIGFLEKTVAEIKRKWEISKIIKSVANDGERRQVHPKISEARPTDEREIEIMLPPNGFSGFTRTEFPTKD